MPALAERATELETLRKLDPLIPTPEVQRHLLAYSGIGPYAAATLLMLVVDARR